MALRTPPSWLQNGSHPAENDRLTTKAIFTTTGLINSSDLQITQNGGGNMSVNVSSGYAAIVGTTQANMGTYIAYNDASTNLTISTASGSNPRIDLIVVTINDAYYTGTLNNVSFQVIAGTPAASPTVPATPANSLALGQIAVGTSVTSILTANITNYGTLTTSPFAASVTLTNAVTLTNKSLSDSTTFIVDATDATKRLNIDVTGTTGITGTLTSAFTTAKTLTLPDVTDTLVAKTTTDTLTNKTLTAPVIATIVNTGTLTLPTVTDTIVARTTSDTLTNKTLTAPVISSIVNTGTLTLPTATDTLVARTTTDTLTNKTLAGSVFQYPLEAWYINATAFAGYTAYLQTNNGVHYLTTASSANGTLNITYASGTTLNTVMTTGQAITFSLLITNTTAFYVSAVQVDGGAITPKWTGGTAPTAGNASAVDIYSFTILKTGSAAFTVLAAGPVKYA